MIFLTIVNYNYYLFTTLQSNLGTFAFLCIFQSFKSLFNSFLGENSPKRMKLSDNFHVGIQNNQSFDYAAPQFLIPNTHESSGPSIASPSYCEPYHNVASPDTTTEKSNSLGGNVLEDISNNRVTLIDKRSQPLLVRNRQEKDIEKETEKGSLQIKMTSKFFA